MTVPPSSLRVCTTVLLASPRMPWYAALIALLVGLPAIGLGEMLDDHFLRVSLLRDPAYAFLRTPPLDVFRLFDGDPVRTMRMVDHGLAAWWSDAHLRIAFFRPLTAATHLLDLTFAEDAAWWMHLHSLLYYALAAAMAALVFRGVLGAGKAAGLAAVMFAIDATHGMLVGWIANRNQLVATALGLASFWVFLRYGAQAPRRAENLVLGPLLLALGLSGGEAALGVVGYFAAHAWVLDERPLRTRLTTLLPYLLVTLAWACFYHASGYGTSGSGFYRDPLHAPTSYATAVVQHLPMLAMNELIGFPADLFVSLTERGRAAFAASAILLALGLGAILLPTLRRDAEARFFGLGGMLALLPVCATEPSARLLLLPSVGLLGMGARFVLDTRARRRAAPRTARVYAGYFLFVHLVVAAPMFHLTARQLSLVEDMVASLAEGLDADALLPSSRVVIVNAPDAAFMLYVGLLRHVTNRPTPRAVTPLAVGIRGLTVTRSAERTLRVRQDDGFLVTPTERLTRDESHPWSVGERVQLSGLTIQVVEVTSDGRPQTVDFMFEQALDDASLRFREWDGQTLVPFDVPALGESRRMEAHRLFGDLSESSRRQLASAR